jgi:hypothetical protein
MKAEIRVQNTVEVASEQISIEDALKRTAFYFAIKRYIKEEILKPKYDDEDLSTMIGLLMEGSGLATRVRPISKARCCLCDTTPYPPPSLAPSLP